MPASLSNKRILLTRPEGQAEKLYKLISNSGGETLLFPTIEIKPIVNSEKLLRCFNKINTYDCVIFISRNAVEMAFDLYLSDKHLLEQIQLFAIGAVTARALNDRGISNVLHTRTQADTESLLERPELQAVNLQGKRILLIRGVGGRELLADTLQERGAEVDYAEVYQRCLPEYETNDIKKLWQNSKPDAIITTSNDGLQNLLKLTINDYRQNLFKTPMVVMSNRAIELAREMGFTSRLEVANEKNDEGLFCTLLNIVGD